MIETNKMSSQINNIRYYLRGLEENHTLVLEEFFMDCCFKFFPILEKGRIFEIDPTQNLEDYILSTIKKVYVRFFIDIPEIFSLSSVLSSDPEVILHDKKCLELFQLSFDLEEFLEFMVQKLISSFESIKQFENLHTSTTILNLIVDDYVASKIKKSRVNNPLKMIRHLKIKKIKNE